MIWRLSCIKKALKYFSFISYVCGCRYRYYCYSYSALLFFCQYSNIEKTSKNETLFIESTDFESEKILRIFLTWTTIQKVSSFLFLALCSAIQFWRCRNSLGLLIKFWGFSFKLTNRRFDAQCFSDETDCFFSKVDKHYDEKKTTNIILVLLNEKLKFCKFRMHGGFVSQSRANSRKVVEAFVPTIMPSSRRSHYPNWIFESIHIKTFRFILSPYSNCSTMEDMLTLH